jgi:hypothetical protein
MQEIQERKETLNEIFERMNEEIQNVIPGIKVDCHISLKGYSKTEKSNIEEKTDGTAKIVSYDAKQITEYPEEKKLAAKVGGTIRREAEKLCINTAIGLICPVSRKLDLFKTILWGMKKADKFNEESEHWKIRFSHSIHNIEGSDKGAIAAINDLIADMMSEIRGAIQDSDEAVLKKVRTGILPKGKNYKQVLELPEEERRPIVAKARAELTRIALSHTKGIELFLPEESGLAVTNLVSDLRKQATAMVKAGKKDNESYELALQEVDLDGVSSLQAAMVRASRNAQKQEQKTLEKEINEMEETVEESAVELPSNVTPLFAIQNTDEIDDSPEINLPVLPIINPALNS